MAQKSWQNLKIVGNLTTVREYAKDKICWNGAAFVNPRAEISSKKMDPV